MNTTAERCWRACAEVLQRFGEDASDSCRQSCFRMASQINEDMALVAAGDGAEVVEYYELVNISDPAKVGTQGSTEEKQVPTRFRPHKLVAREPGAHSAPPQQPLASGLID